jgi:uncharacterized protein YqjF (DUF2071 family)
MPVELVRDPERPFLTATWRDLVMVTWAIDPAVLRPLVPPGTELDRWQGDVLVSLVAFDFADTRLRGVRIPFHVRFPEVNLRFYVRRRGPDGDWRRGAVFVQEMVPRRAIAWVARAVYGEPYVRRPMRRTAVPEASLAGAGPGATRSLVYEWQRGGDWERVIALVAMPPRGMRRGSIEEFIAEHYWGYTRRPGRPTLEYRVRHPRWEIALAADCLVEADLEALYGRAFAKALLAPPVSTFVAEGSEVAIYPGRPIAA